MTEDRLFSHPNFGNQVRLEQRGREVILVFVASDESRAESLAAALHDQLVEGGLHITLLGKPTAIEVGP